MLAGLGLTTAPGPVRAAREYRPVLYPREILYGKRETQQLPAAGQRLRVGGMVMPGSVRRDPDSLKVNFSLYDAEGSVTVSYEGILPDLFREGQGGWCRAPRKGNHVPRTRCWPNMTRTTPRRKWKRRCRKTTAARNALIRTPHHDA
ncbi:cytochrome c maturation protein CcmE [Salmonella enterica subsp. enterica serovar Bareilly]|nr:cytochrome c maturation protein CcmE [Salmonella enterica subsp. enterica serovar Bareilly]